MEGRGWPDTRLHRSHPADIQAHVRIRVHTRVPCVRTRGIVFDVFFVSIFTYWLLRGNWPAPPASHRSIGGCKADVTRCACAGYWFSPPLNATRLVHKLRKRPDTALDHYVCVDRRAHPPPSFRARVTSRVPTHICSCAKCTRANANGLVCACARTRGGMYVGGHVDSSRRLQASTTTPSAMPVSRCYSKAPRGRARC